MSQLNTPTKLFIADGSYLLRQGMKSVFDPVENVEVVGEATTHAELMAALAESGACSLIIDYDSADFSERSVHMAFNLLPGIRVVGITTMCRVSVVRRLIDKGLQGHLLKDCDQQEVMDSILETAEGGKFFCGKILDEINRSQGLDSEFGCDPVSLSERETEILQLVAQGKTTKEIAADLHLSFHTVMTHRKNMMNKLGTGNTAGLIIYAVRENLIQPNKFLFSSEPKSEGSK